MQPPNAVALHERIASDLLARHGPALAAGMSAQRWQHSQGVMWRMLELASIYELDPTQAAWAGLCHDVAKDYSPAAQLDLATKYQIALNAAVEQHPVYLHGVAGAALLRHEWGCRDEAALHAIAAHSYNRWLDPCATSWRLGWCLRIADLLAPVGPWLGMQRLREIAEDGQLEQAALLLCVWVKEYYQARDIPVHQLVLTAEHELRLRVQPSADFFTRW